ncbi:SNF2 superfamily protein [Anaeromyxobacter dehalogenans 2CP-1]|uniref:SNF2 superfamily protein n=1 Tax=Anaeromyxobacter dehalogenans (strain ATCC BAA-258 / DSM 21875 / 2CP-1) TaxID=455488 RepID=B8J969_ANAD2|nr:hypothetical protein [Anaeromyxobacter dehalogenans]ACL65475.1 SNF2 superfamily protein [Anaeromyxobacter dehalogenans 2CP-1]
MAAFIAAPQYAGGVATGVPTGYVAVQVSDEAAAAHVAKGGRLATQAEIDAETARAAAAAAASAASKQRALDEFDARAAEARTHVG